MKEKKTRKNWEKSEHRGEEKIPFSRQTRAKNSPERKNDWMQKKKAY